MSDIKSLLNTVTIIMYTRVEYKTTLFDRGFCFFKTAVDKDDLVCCGARGIL